MTVECVILSTRGIWGHALQENSEFRSSQIPSGTIWDKIVV